MGSEEVAVYYIGRKTYHVYGCWDEDTPENQFDFYDVYENSVCINEGNPLFSLPTYQEVKEVVSGR